MAEYRLKPGTNLRYIQTPLGHTSSKTNETCTHARVHYMQDIVNPWTT